MNKEQRRLRKQHKRQRKNKEALFQERVARTMRRKLAEYPRFSVGNREADPEFTDAILTAVRQLDFLDTERLGSGFQSFLKLGREHGFEEVFRALREAISIEYGENRLSSESKLVSVLTNIGSHILSSVPIALRRKHMPYNNVSVTPVQDCIRLDFTSMDSAWGENGQIYFGRHKPTINFGGKKYTVAFSRHSIERICKRINPRYTEYCAACDTHALFNNCVYFEPVLLHGEQPAFAIFDICDYPGFAAYHKYVAGVFGEENIRQDGGKLYYRVGYCPVALEGSFAKAKTFMPPGFAATPEYGLVLHSDMRPIERQEFLNRISDDSSSELDRLWTHDNEATKWFHENGHPQVFQWKHDVFVSQPSIRKNACTQNATVM